MKRTPLARRTGLSSRTSLPRGARLAGVSPKRRRELAVYGKVRATYLAEHPRCGFPLGCDQPATTVQHLRGRRGDRLLDVAFWAPSCWPHNAWAEDHTGEALAIGWLVRIEGAA